MPDTGKLKRLFIQATTDIRRGKGETMAYPDGDLDGIAEQLFLYIERLEQDHAEGDRLTRETEGRLAYVMGEVRRAHKCLEGAIKGAEAEGKN